MGKPREINVVSFPHYTYIINTDSREAYETISAYKDNPDLHSNGILRQDGQK
jgi:hypothetical protein